MLNRIRKNDTVSVNSGRDRGKEGRVIEINTKKKRVLVKDACMITKHVKPRRQGEQAGIVKKESYIPFCKVMPVCPSCKKPCRIRIKVSGKEKLRVCHRCGGEF